MSENNHMWTAVAILGGIYAYSMLKEDAGKLKDGVVDIAKDVADAVNITKDTNLASRGARAVFGEDAIIDGVGGRIARFLGTDPTEKKLKLRKEVNITDARNLASRGARAVFGEDTIINGVGGRIARFLGTDPMKSTTKEKPKATTAKPVDAGLPAKSSNGKWLKFQNGKWLPLTKSDKVFTIKGKYVVHHYQWKP